MLAQFSGDNRTVTATPESEFYNFLGCDPNSLSPCIGTVDEFVQVFFGGRFKQENELEDILILGLFLVSARVLTFFALKHFNFSAT